MASEPHLFCVNRRFRAWLVQLTSIITQHRSQMNTPSLPRRLNAKSCELLCRHAR
jgi:hypothetical protein